MGEQRRRPAHAACRAAAGRPDALKLPPPQHHLPLRCATFRTSAPQLLALLAFCLYAACCAAGARRSTQPHCVAMTPAKTATTRRPCRGRRPLLQNRAHCLLGNVVVVCMQRRSRSAQPWTAAHSQKHLSAAGRVRHDGRTPQGPHRKFHAADFRRGQSRGVGGHICGSKCGAPASGSGTAIAFCSSASYACKTKRDFDVMLRLDRRFLDDQMCCQLVTIPAA